MKDEDIMFEQRRQARIDAENWDMKQSIPWHQKVGTKVPFSRTVDKDPWKDIPLSVPVDGTNKPNLWITVTCIVLALLILWGVNQ